VRRETRNNIDKHGIIKPLSDYRAELRQRPTEAENTFWEYCKSSGLFRQVRPQMIFGWYIVDFFFTENHVAVEFDGSSHANRRHYDWHRDKWIEECGAVVLRFPNEAADTPEVVVEQAQKWRPDMELDRLLTRATTKRRAYNEVKLALKGLQHDNHGHLISLQGETRSFDQLLKSIVDLPHKRADGKKLKCYKCKTVASKNFHRCKGCNEILRFGWEELIGLEPVTIKRGRILSIDGKRARPRCPKCQRAVSNTWTTCEGCLSPIDWE